MLVYVPLKEVGIIKSKATEEQTVEADVFQISLTN